MQTIIYKGYTLPTIDLEVVEQAVRGKIEVKWFVGNQDMGLDLRLSLAGLRAYEEAKQNRFVVYSREKKGKRQIGSPAGAYFHWCEAWGEPYIRVLKRKAHTEVDLDMISTNRRLGPEAIITVEQVLHRFSLPRARIYRGKCYNQSTRVRPEEAERLAAILYAIATDFQPRCAVPPLSKRMPGDHPV